MWCGEPAVRGPALQCGWEDMSQKVSVAWGWCQLSGMAAVLQQACVDRGRAAQPVPGSIPFLPEPLPISCEEQQDLLRAPPLGWGLRAILTLVPQLSPCAVDLSLSLFCHTSGTWKFLGWGSNPRYSCSLRHSCSNTRSSTSFATAGTPNWFLSKRISSPSVVPPHFPPELMVPSSRILRPANPVSVLCLCHKICSYSR